MPEAEQAAESEDLFEADFEAEPEGFLEPENLPDKVGLVADKNLQAVDKDFLVAGKVAGKVADTVVGKVAGKVAECYKRYSSAEIVLPVQVQKA